MSEVVYPRYSQKKHRKCVMCISLSVNPLIDRSRRKATMPKRWELPVGRLRNRRIIPVELQRNFGSGWRTVSGMRLSINSIFPHDYSSAFSSISTSLILFSTQRISTTGSFPSRSLLTSPSCVGSSAGPLLPLMTLTPRPTRTVPGRSHDRRGRRRS